MPSLPQNVLFAKLRAGLPGGTTFSGRLEVHPAVLNIPRFGPARVYLWTITHVESEDRPLDEARGSGWAVASPRRVADGMEVRVAFTAGNLYRYLRLAREADNRNLFGTEREAFFLARTPNVGGLEPPAGEEIAADRLVQRI